MNEDLVVYTCITGSYDTLLPVPVPEAGVRYVCLSDGSVVPTAGWEMLPLPGTFPHPALANRYAKMHPDLLFPDQQCSVYIDGNIEPLPGVRVAADAALREHEVAIHRHPYRDCVYKEAVECASIGHDWIWRFERHMRRYRSEGLPAGHGLFECNILFRRHHAPEVKALMRAWWDEYLRGAKRDQLSFPYVVWRSPVRLNRLGMSGVREGQGAFRLRIGHQPDTRGRQLRGRVNKLLPLFWIAAWRSGWTPP